MSAPFSLIPPSIRNAASKAVIQDAGAKVTVSLSLIAALAYGAYTLGAKESEKVANIELTLARVTTILERMEATQIDMKADQKDMRKDVSVLNDRASGMRGELNVIQSKIDSK